MASSTKSRTRVAADSTTVQYERLLGILLDRLDSHENCRHESCHARRELQQFLRMTEIVKKEK